MAERLESGSRNDDEEDSSGGLGSDESLDLERQSLPQGRSSGDVMITDGDAMSNEDDEDDEVDNKLIHSSDDDAANHPLSSSPNRIQNNTSNQNDNSNHDNSNGKGIGISKKKSSKADSISQMPSTLDISATPTRRYSARLSRGFSDLSPMDDDSLFFTWRGCTVPRKPLAMTVALLTVALCLFIIACIESADDFKSGAPIFVICLIFLIPGLFSLYRIIEKRRKRRARGYGRMK